VLENSTQGLESNCGGTWGFSGTGYLNNQGELRAVHEGEAQFRHSYGEFSQGIENGSEPFGSKEGASQDTWRDAETDCLNGSQAAMVTPQCLKSLKHAWNVAVLNPRMNLIPAHYLYELARNATTNQPPSVMQAPDVNVDGGQPEISALFHCDAKSHVEGKNNKTGHAQNRIATQCHEHFKK
jgi:hypothetical protein